MTFKEKLISISELVNLDLDIAGRCAAIQDKMTAAAEAGYRTFQIEVIRLLGDGSITMANADNCYTILYTYKPDKIALILNKVKDYLYQLGFNHCDIEQTSIKHSMYTAVVLKVEW